MKSDIGKFELSLCHLIWNFSKITACVYQERLREFNLIADFKRFEFFLYWDAVIPTVNISSGYPAANRDTKCPRSKTRLRFWTAPALSSRTGLIIIAAGVSGHNYQRRLIQSLIASFNLFTFGAEQRQPAAVESD